MYFSHLICVLHVSCTGEKIESLFLVNYLCSSLTSPLLLIALFASGGAFYYANAKNTVRKLAIAGKLIHVYIWLIISLL